MERGQRLLKTRAQKSLESTWCCGVAHSLQLALMPWSTIGVRDHFVDTHSFRKVQTKLHTKEWVVYFCEFSVKPEDRCHFQEVILCSAGYDGLAHVDLRENIVRHGQLFCHFNDFRDAIACNYHSAKKILNGYENQDLKQGQYQKPVVKTMNTKHKEAFILVLLQYTGREVP